MNVRDRAEKKSPHDRFGNRGKSIMYVFFCNGERCSLKNHVVAYNLQRDGVSPSCGRFRSNRKEGKNGPECWKVATRREVLRSSLVTRLVRSPFSNHSS